MAVDEHEPVTRDDLDRLAAKLNNGMHLSVDDGLWLIHEIRRLRDAAEAESAWLRCETCHHAILDHEEYASPGRVTETGIRCEACHAARDRNGVADGH